MYNYDWLQHNSLAYRGRSPPLLPNKWPKISIQYPMDLTFLISRPKYKAFLFFFCVGSLPTLLLTYHCTFPYLVSEIFFLPLHMLKG
jgi:hypothetical protein